MRPAARAATSAQAAPPAMSSGEGRPVRLRAPQRDDRSDQGGLQRDPRRDGQALGRAHPALLDTGGARASSWVESVGETMPMPSAARPSPASGRRSRRRRARAAPGRATRGDEGGAEPQPGRCAEAALRPVGAVEPRAAAQSTPVTDSETPASAVDASWVCTSMSGMSPATPVKAAETSSRSVTTVGSPGAAAPCRAAAHGRRRRGRRRSRPRGPATPAPGWAAPPAASREQVVTARPAARTRAARTRRRSDAARRISPLTPGVGGAECGSQREERERHDDERRDEDRPPARERVEPARHARAEQ